MSLRKTERLVNDVHKREVIFQQELYILKRKHKYSQPVDSCLIAQKIFTLKIWVDIFKKFCQLPSFLPPSFPSFSPFPLLSLPSSLRQSLLSSLLPSFPSSLPHSLPFFFLQNKTIVELLCYNNFQDLADIFNYARFLLLLKAS